MKDGDGAYHPHQLGLGFKFKPKPKTIMGKIALLFTVCLSTCEDSTGGTMKRGAMAALGKEEQRRRGEEGSCGGGLAMSRRCCCHWLLVQMRA